MALENATHIFVGLVDVVVDEGASTIGETQNTEIIEEITQSADSDENKPNIEEKIKFFVDHVHHNDTLDGVSLEISQSSDSKVAENDTGENLGFLP